MESRCGILIALSLVAGCAGEVVTAVPQVGWLAGSWEIDGAVPDQASCARAGIELVRVRATEVGGTTENTITQDCDTGAITLGVGGSSGLVPDRTYVVRLEGLSGLDTVVASGPERTVTVGWDDSEVRAPTWSITTVGP